MGVHSRFNRRFISPGKLRFCINSPGFFMLSTKDLRVILYKGGSDDVTCGFGI